MVLCSMWLPFFVVDAQITETDTLSWNMQLRVSGNFAFGNVERVLLANNVEVLHSFPSKNWVFKSAHQFRYGEVNDRKIDHQYVGNVYIYNKPFKKLYPFYLSLYETNFRLRIKSRVQNGLGVTWVPIKKKRHLLKISTALIYDVSKYDDEVVFNDLSLTSFKSIRPTLRIYGEHVMVTALKINYEFIDQISVSTQGNQRILAFIGLGYRLNTSISLQAKLQFSHEDITAADVKPDDWLMTYGISFAPFK